MAAQWHDLAQWPIPVVNSHGADASQKGRTTKQDNTPTTRDAGGPGSNPALGKQRSRDHPIDVPVPATPTLIAALCCLPPPLRPPPPTRAALCVLFCCGCGLNARSRTYSLTRAHTEHTYSRTHTHKPTHTPTHTHTHTHTYSRTHTHTMHAQYRPWYGLSHVGRGWRAVAVQAWVGLAALEGCSAERNARVRVSARARVRRHLVRAARALCVRRAHFHACTHGHEETMARCAAA